MGYSGAGLGFGLQQGFSGLGATLMGIGDRKREQEAREQAIKMHQMERREDQTRQSERWAMEDSRYADQQARIADATANAETIRRGEALSGAMDKANEYMAGGQQASVNPGKVYFTGSPLDGTLQQNQTLQAESGIPTVTPGAYDPTLNPKNQDIKWQGDYFTGMGDGTIGPKGQVSTRGPGRNYSVTVGGEDILYDGDNNVIDRKPHVSGGGGSAKDRMLDRLTDPPSGGADDEAGEGGSSNYEEEVRELNADLRSGNLTQDQHGQILARIKAKYGR